MGASDLTKKFEKLDIFSSLKKAQDSKKRSSTSPVANKAGKLQSNQKPKPQANYHDRTKRGQVADIYNEGVQRLPGNLNPNGSIYVNTDELGNYSL